MQLSQDDGNASLFGQTWSGEDESLSPKWGYQILDLDAVKLLISYGFHICYQEHRLFLLYMSLVCSFLAFSLGTRVLKTC